MRRRIHVTLDCGIPPCAFSDADFGLISKLGVSRDKCLPRPGVLPDLRLYHCHQMVRYASGNLRRHRFITEAMDWLYRRNSEAQWDLRFFPHCDECDCIPAETCMGECIVVKKDRLLARIDELKPVVEKEENLDALIEIGTLYWEMREVANAKECLTEARRVDPGNGDVHLLLAQLLRHTREWTESEEEFQKASRLLPDGRRALLELSEMYHERGQHKKADEIVKGVVADSEGKDMPDFRRSSGRGAGR